MFPTLTPAGRVERRPDSRSRALLGLHLVPAAAARGDGRHPRRAATRSSCCRPAAASRSASRRRRSCAGLGVVVSPLISLMKDQVDTLVGNGVPAALYNSSLSRTEAAVSAGTARGRYRLLYVSPERSSARAATGSSRGSPVRRPVRRGRRGALHQPVGARLPAGVPPARPAAQLLPGRQPACVHGDGDGARAARHRRAARAARSRSSSSARSIGRTSSTACSRARA